MAYGPPRASYSVERQRPPAMALRLVASLLDLLVMVTGVLLVGVLLSGFVGSIAASAYAYGFIVYGTWYLYKPIAEAATGRTAGKWMMGLKVVDARTGGPIGFGAALVRSLVLAFGSVPICGLVAVLSERRRGLHDLVAGTVVVASEPSV
jgi:uncharacterized RDD family membrane protein YckC